MTIKSEGTGKKLGILANFHKFSDVK
jgi:hypothetical protein